MPYRVWSNYWDPPIQHLFQGSMLTSFAQKMKHRSMPRTLTHDVTYNGLAPVDTLQLHGTCQHDNTMTAQRSYVDILSQQWLLNIAWTHAILTLNRCSYVTIRHRITLRRRKHLLPPPTLVHSSVRCSTTWHTPTYWLAHATQYIVTYTRGTWIVGESMREEAYRLADSLSLMVTFETHPSLPYIIQ